ncbi:porin [Pelomonas sp. KK5]|uniref:porin n=1 Tax=Pelomonas sp. KK5 TaxID=1855730 RepID=UPI00097CB096|nr:porin [Pelomonas sp. KK5]
MKMKALTLAALAALATPAMAQVTIYGKLDAGLLSISNTSGGTGYLPSAVNNGSSKQLKDGGIGASNWGLRGVEDLGGGLKAIFVLQGNLALDTGASGGPNSGSTSSMWNQTAMVGLIGSFGEIKLGRQVSPMYWAMASTDARAGRYFGSSLTALVGLNSASGNFVGDNSNPSFGTVYNDNAILWTSPVWSNVTVNLEYALGETAGGMKANSQQAATLVYDDKKLKLSALYYNGYGNNLPDATLVYTKKLGDAAKAAAALTAAGLTPTTNTNRLVSLGALYNWGEFRAGAAWMQARNPSHVVVMPGGSDSLDMWDLSVGWTPMPQLDISAGYYRIKDKKNIGNSASQFALGAEYSLSKRTTLYAEGAMVTNKGANMNVSPVYATAVVAGKDVHALMAGIRHAF